MATDTTELVAGALQAIDEHRIADALSALNKALELDPSSANVRHGLGLLALRTGEPVIALNLFNEAHRLAPNVAEHAEALAVVYAKLGKLPDALFFGKLSPSLKNSELPGLLPSWMDKFFDAFMNIKQAPLLQSGFSLYESGQFAEAEAMFNRELNLDPHTSDAWRGLASTQLELGKPLEALQALRGLMALGNTTPQDLSMLGRALTRCGRAVEGMALHDRALRQDPDDAAAELMRLADMRFAPMIGASAMTAAAKTWAAALPAPHEPEERFFEPLDGRKLRLGLLSGNLDAGRASLNALTPFLQRGDAAGWELTVFSAARFEDQATRRLRHVAFDWIDIREIDDATAALMIENAELDVLIVLDDIGLNDRPGLLLQRPNCLVLYWAEQPAVARALGTQGVVGDAVVLGDQAADDAAFVLPTPMFGLAEDAVTPLPLRDEADQRLIGVRARRQDFTPENCAVLADVLAALPDCMLLVDHLRVGGPLGFDDLVEQFAWHGCSERIASVADVTPETADQVFFDMADLIIDLGPLSDVDTAVAALCRGRPVVTLAGDLPAGRKTASALTALSLTDWIAASPAGLIEVARGIMADRAVAQEKAAAAVASGEGAKPLGRAKALEAGLRRVVADYRGA